MDSTTHPNGLTFCLWSDQIMSLNLILQKGNSAGLKKKSMNYSEARDEELFLKNENEF